VHANQFFPAVAQTDAGLPIGVENYQFITQQKKSVGGVVHKSAEAHLAFAQLAY
jgi:hypothetical protein